MILEIYKSMIETVQNTEAIPKYITLTYHVNNDVNSKDFWDNKELLPEQEILLNEWTSPKEGLYTKTFYGVKFAIQFEKTTKK